MDDKMQPMSITGSRIKLSVQRTWHTLPAGSSDGKFLRSWLVYDSELDEDDQKGRIQWNVVLGMALVIGISVVFWAGVALVIARIWK